MQNVHVNVPQIRTPSDNVSVRHGQVSPSQRRASYLVRSVAIDDTLLPRKQTSSPLPEHAQRIYERDHVHSRSWNAEGYRYDVREPIAEDPYARNVPPSLQPRPSSSRLLRPLVPYPSNGIAMVSAGQIRNVVDRPPMRPITYSPSMNPPPREMHRYSPRRARSESIRNTLVRQRAATAQPDLEVDEHCHGLWSERRRLEHSALRNERPLPPRMVSRQFSADASDELSTSFESNWGPPQGSRGIVQGGRSDRIRPCPPPVRWNDEHGTEAALRRQKYRDLLIQRNMPSRSIHPETSSFDSDATALQPIASSMESSARSAHEGLAMLNNTPLQMHNGRVENLYGRKPSVMPRNVSRAKSLWRKVPHVVHATFRRDARSYEMRRDYSVDAQTDQIFREFARVDPKYEPSPKTSDAPTYRSPTPRGSKWPRWSSDGSQNRIGWFP
ncbi:Protein Y48C3A.5 a [Aphelenchoides avenae]|nr:Protein Y48C3A.5 a [Aphelenchus avenae]